MEVYDVFIQHCREKIGPPPRTFPWLQRKSYLRISRPAWCGPDEKLGVFFDNKDELLKHGVVMWGHVVQANSLLFEPGADNCPGEIVYPLAVGKPCDVEELSRVAGRLFQLKGSEPTDKAERRIADHLTNERTREFGAPIPKSCSPTMKCGLSTVFFVRGHLPDRLLRSPLMPILLNPKPPFIAMPLPDKFWPEMLLEWWRM